MNEVFMKYLPLNNATKEGQIATVLSTYYCSRAQNIISVGLEPARQSAANELLQPTKRHGCMSVEVTYNLFATIWSYFELNDDIIISVI